MTIKWTASTRQGMTKCQELRVGRAAMQNRDQMRKAEGLSCHPKQWQSSSAVLEAHKQHAYLNIAKPVRTIQIRAALLLPFHQPPLQQVATQSESKAELLLQNQTICKLGQARQACFDMLSTTMGVP
jgi:hypothetical protein